MPFSLIVRAPNSHLGPIGDLSPAQRDSGRTGCTRQAGRTYANNTKQQTQETLVCLSVIRGKENTGEDNQEQGHKIRTTTRLEKTTGSESPRFQYGGQDIQTGTHVIHVQCTE